MDAVRTNGPLGIAGR